VVLPFTFNLSLLCYSRFQEQIHSKRSCLLICLVNILFIYILSLTLFWSFLMTASYKYAWIVSPFGLILSIFFVFIFLKTYRCKFLLNTNEMTNQTSGVNSKLLAEQA